jgi:hypothetical protein
VEANPDSSNFLFYSIRVSVNTKGKEKFRLVLIGMEPFGTKGTNMAISFSNKLCASKSSKLIRAINTSSAHIVNDFFANLGALTEMRTCISINIV